MKKIIECDIKSLSFSQDNYIVFSMYNALEILGEKKLLRDGSHEDIRNKYDEYIKSEQIVFKKRGRNNGEYHIKNKPHYCGDLKFKFDDDELKNINYISKEDKIKELCLKTNQSTKEIIERSSDVIEIFYKKNTSNFISKILGDSMVNRFAKIFYNKSYKKNKKISKVEQAIKLGYSFGYYSLHDSSCLSIDFYNKHIDVLINFNVLKNNTENHIEEYKINKERYLKEGWNWSESKIEDIKKSYQNTLSTYQNLINISSLYDIKLNFILDGVKECDFSCEFKEID